MKPQVRQPLEDTKWKRNSVVCPPRQLSPRITSSYPALSSNDLARQAHLTKQRTLTDPTRQPVGLMYIPRLQIKSERLVTSLTHCYTQLGKSSKSMGKQLNLLEQHGGFQPVAVAHSKPAQVHVTGGPIPPSLSLPDLCLWPGSLLSVSSRFLGLLAAFSRFTLQMVSAESPCWPGPAACLHRL